MVSVRSPGLPQPQGGSQSSPARLDTYQHTAAHRGCPLVANPHPKWVAQATCGCARRPRCSHTAWRGGLLPSHPGFLPFLFPDPSGLLHWPFQGASSCLHSHGLTSTFRSNDAFLKKKKPTKPLVQVFKKAFKIQFWLLLSFSQLLLKYQFCLDRVWAVYSTLPTKGDLHHSPASTPPGLSWP